MYRQEKSLLLMSTASAVPNNLAVNTTSNTGFAEQVAVIHPGYVSIIPLDDDQKAKYVAVRSSTGETLLAQVSQVMWCKLGSEVWFIIASSLGVQVFDTEAETCFFMHSCQDSSETVDGNRPNLTTVGSQLLCVGNSTGSIYVFRILDRQCQAVLVDRQKGHKHGISALAGATSSSMLASGDQDGNVVVWIIDRDRLHKDASFPSYGFACTSLQLWHSYVLVAYGSGHIRLFSAQPTAAMLVEVAAHARWITALDLAPDSGRLLSVAEDSLIRVWQLNDHQPMIEHLFVHPIKDSMLVGSRFLTSTGSAFCASSYDSCEVHHFHIN